MHTFKRFLSGALLTAGFVTTSALADCGSAPAAPEVPDGATVTMEELVAASNEVKTFIANADTYLDCRQAAMQSKTYKKLSDEEKDSWKEGMIALTKSRNEIGDNFNAQVQAFKEANP